MFLWLVTSPLVTLEVARLNVPPAGILFEAERKLAGIRAGTASVDALRWAVGVVAGGTLKLDAIEEEDSVEDVIAHAVRTGASTIILPMEWWRLDREWCFIRPSLLHSRSRFQTLKVLLPRAKRLWWKKYGERFLDALALLLDAFGTVTLEWHPTTVWPSGRNPHELVAQHIGTARARV